MQSYVCAEEGQLIGHQPAASLAFPSSGSSPQSPWGSLPLSIQKIWDLNSKASPQPIGTCLPCSEWLVEGEHLEPRGLRETQARNAGKDSAPHHLKLQGLESWGWSCYLVTGGARE